MERKRGPPHNVIYNNTFVKPNHISTFAEDLGFCFASGSGGGFLYHLTKLNRTNKQLPLTCKLSASLANAPRIGGFFVLWSISGGLPRQALYNLRGYDSYIDDIASAAAGTAIMWSPRGLRSASKAAGIAAASYAGLIYFTLWNRRSLAQMSLDKAKRSYDFPS